MNPLLSPTSLLAAQRSHYSARELAELKLAGLPGSERGVRFAAERGQWPHRPRAKGKGVEYAPPQTVLTQLQARAIAELARTRLAEPVAPPLATATETGNPAQIADARRGVLAALEKLIQHTGYSRKQAAGVLLEMARQGVAGESLPAMLRLARDPRGRRSADGLPSVRSLLRFTEYRKAGALTPKRRQAAPSVPDWAAPFLALYQCPEKPTVEHAYRRFISEWPLRPVPSIWQVRRFLAKIGRISHEAGRLGPRELKSLRPFVPAVLYVDNGSGYRNQLMSDPATGLMGQFGIEMVHSLPYNSQARGVIERLHQTLWVSAARELPGYLGRDMDREACLAQFKLTRRAIAGRGGALGLIDWDDFLAFCAAQVAADNAQPHRSLAKLADPSNGRRRHQSPDEAWAAQLADTKARTWRRPHQATAEFRTQQRRAD
ncbi:hypothetical protein OL229_21280 [Neisseriaceae bacterium JH1-16]|nr:hypothetical protein [Neisseriaceae bacterium JH1-16]